MNQEEGSMSNGGPSAPDPAIESPGGAVPMLCPGCCTLQDIPDWPDHDAADLKTVIGCHRCGFTFPLLPGAFKSLTLDAMHNHRCEGPEAGNWDAVGKAITEQLGELQQHDPDQLATFFRVAFGQPDDEPPQQVNGRTQSLRAGPSRATPAPAGPGPTRQTPKTHNRVTGPSRRARGDPRVRPPPGTASAFVRVRRLSGTTAERKADRHPP